MKIIIYDLSITAYEQITDELTSRWAESVIENDDDDGVDVVLNQCTSLKTHHDVAFLDLGGKLAKLLPCDYRVIELY